MDRQIGSHTKKSSRSRKVNLKAKKKKKMLELVDKEMQMFDLVNKKDKHKRAGKEKMQDARSGSHVGD